MDTIEPCGADELTEYERRGLDRLLADLLAEPEEEDPERWDGME